MIGPAHFVVFKADGIGSVRVLLGDGAVKPTDGYGGWTVVTRPRRVGLTQWTGNNPIRVDVPILFDGFLSGDGQEIRIGKLSRMGLPQGERDEPPVVTVEGAAFPHLGPKKWVIENIDWGDDVIVDTDTDSGSLVRVRQDAVVHLIQYVAEDRTAFKNVEVGSGAWPKHYTWKHGDTLQKVSSKFYKNSKKWKQIAQANNIRDPKHIKVGRLLIIPKPK